MAEGAPAYDAVTMGPVPQRFINGTKGNVSESEKRWAATLHWRKEQNIDTLLDEVSCFPTAASQTCTTSAAGAAAARPRRLAATYCPCLCCPGLKPQRNFAHLKAHYPQYLHGKAKNGQHLYIERPGLADFPALTSVCTMDELVRREMGCKSAAQLPPPEGRQGASGLSAPALSLTASAAWRRPRRQVRYYVFTTEYVWCKLDRRQTGALVSIWDCTNVSASSLAGDRLKMLKMTMATISAHYPERSDKLFIINVSEASVLCSSVAMGSHGRLGSTSIPRLASTLSASPALQALPPYRKPPPCC